MPTPEPDLITEARELLASTDALPNSVEQIEHALWADAIERQHESPFWGRSKTVARVYARAPELIATLANEVEERRTEIKTLELTVEGLLDRLGCRNED